MQSGCGTSGPVHYRLLGPLEMTIGGRVISVGGPRARALLAALVLDAGRVIPVDRLVTAVWGDHAPDTAQTQVRNLASKVRRTLRDAGAADDVLTQEGTGYVVNDALGHRDIDAVEDRARAAADFRGRGAL